MPDGKYGRLFTEADVRRLVLAADIAAWKRGRTGRGLAPEPEALLADALGAVLATGEPLTFPADEPLFLLRAQDKAAPMAALNYVREAVAYGASEAFCDRASRDGYTRMREWQNEHPDRVKVPD